MPETREQIIERMARAEWGVIWPNSDPDLMGMGFVSATAAALPVAVKAVTDRVRGGLRDAAFQGLVTTDDLLALLDQIDAELGGER
ncbi:hypothetical protein ATK74_1785 [Propionicimonas paludicola]|uniref:Uncharacterized protein n=1 Tax=Propionicimonas paludicola TaxID=185243 RepID=A0A2A9CU93_9ACTN|nr:hypothetical protein [Propionicimonas paludicola]PFG17222.1 hypothetical protein ATK74_1785 [Propionicimonas paludicola]